MGMELALESEVIQDAVMYALYHDDSEVVTGDIPSPAKKVGVIRIDEDAMPRLVLQPNTIFFSRSKELVKLCDLIEALIFCTEEQMMGNRLIEEVTKDIKTNLIKTIHTDWRDWSTDIYGLIDRHIAAMFDGAFYVGNLNVRPR
jgi:5'-deoxynucleotidase YfbR-like HD superfamily hydrolase